MLKRFVLLTLVLAMASPLATADIILNYDPATGIPVDMATDLTLSLTTNPGFNTTVAGIIFAFDPFDEGYQMLNPTAFAFAEQFTDPMDWFFSEDLPTKENPNQNPQTVTFAQGPDLPDGVSLEIATLTIEPVAVGTWSLAANLIIADNDFNELDIKGGDPQSLMVIPEPGSVCLLALGMLAVVRRRVR